MKPSKLLTSLFILIPALVLGSIIKVDQNGGGHHTSIQEGIENARRGDTVLVYPGNYIEIVDFIGKDIVVGSLFLTTQDTSFISQTIINGNQENYRLVRFTNGETENARLIGFTITNASDPPGKSGKWASEGLGIYINGSSPIIESNRITNNSYKDWYSIGGGIVIENSSAKIIDNTISKNNMAYCGGGIYIKNSTNIHIKNNRIQNNETFSGYGVSAGAGIYIDSSQNILISHNIIKNNYLHVGSGGGIYAFKSNHIVILNNIITGQANACLEGGGIYALLSTDISIVGNLLHHNEANWRGGGLYLENSEALLVNNTICFNQSMDGYGKGGGLSCLNSSPIIYNTILFSNSAATSGNQVYLDANSDPDFFYSDIEGGLAAFGLEDTVLYTGHYENNIDADPLFMLSGDYPYSLDIGSPCINAGNPDTTGLFIPEFDLAGNERIVQNSIDIGAFESPLSIHISDLNKPGNILIFPNPATDKISIYIPEEQFQKGWISIYDLKGNSVLNAETVNPLQEFELSSLARGIYIIKITSGEFIKTEKIMLF